MKYEVFNHQDLGVVIDWLNQQGAHKLHALVPYPHGFAAVIEHIKMGRPSAK